MFDGLTSIPGPIFLIIYIVYAIIIIFLIKGFVLRDYTLRYEVPEPTKLEPLEIAILKSGVKGAIIITIFNLWRHQGVDISLKNRAIVLKQKQTDTSKFNKLEKTIYNFVQQPKFYRYLFLSKSVKTIDKILQPNKSRLQELKLAPDPRIIKQHWSGILYGFLLLLGFGGIKLYFGIVRNKPVGFLIILMVLSVIALFIVIHPARIKISALGQKLIDNSKQRFAWLKSSKNGANLLMDDNLLYGIALFGISSFMGTELGSLLENPILLDQKTGSSSYGYGCGCAGCGGGCGSGCSGGCGGCGGD